MIQWPCGTGTNQQWQVQDTGDGHVRFAARHSGKCLGVEASSTTDGTAVRQYACTGSAGTQWTRQNS